jgi:hypothetical protein
VCVCVSVCVCEDQSIDRSEDLLVLQTFNQAADNQIHFVN